MIGLLITRLTGTAPLKLVAGAADFATAAETKPAALAAAYVLPLHEAAGANQLDCAVMQMVSVSFGIAYAVANVADAKGKAALTALEQVRQAGRDKLLGWAPEGADPLEYGGGALLGFKNGVVWWQDIYTTQYLIKA